MILKLLKNYSLGILLLLGAFIIDQIPMSFIGIPGQHVVWVNTLITIWSLSMMILAIYTIYIVYQKTLKNNIMKIDNTSFSLKKGLIVIGALITSYVVVNVTTSWLHVEQTSNQNILNEVFKNNKMMIFIVIVFYAPIIEELIFRGLFFNFLLSKEFVTKNNEIIFKILCVLLSSFLFAFVHTMGINKELAVYWPMGLILSSVYLFTKDIKANILVHFLNNFIAGLFMIMM